MGAQCYGAALGAVGQGCSALWGSCGPPAGYAVSALLFADGRRLLVGGAPRFRHRGAVLLFTMGAGGALRAEQTLRGEQVGQHGGVGLLWGCVIWGCYWGCYWGCCGVRSLRDYGFMGLRRYGVGIEGLGL